MPTFKIKNLMIDVVAARVPDLDKLCLIPTNVNCGNIISRCLFLHSSPPHTPDCCRWPSYNCLCTFQPTPCIPTPCPHGSVLECVGPTVDCAGSDLPVGCGGGSDWVVIDLGKLVVNPESIKDVQAELEKVWPAVKERATELSLAIAPQTLAQAKLLEEQLTDALNAVGQMKEKLGGVRTAKK